MKPEKLLEELKSVAQQIGVSVRMENGKFSGGYCLLHQKKMIVINKKIPVESKVVVLARSLAHFPLEGIYLKPAIREYIEDEKPKEVQNGHAYTNGNGQIPALEESVVVEQLPEAEEMAVEN